MSIYIENFETIFGAANNIQALRNKVLELAIQGKLVEQDPEDEPARELVKKIKADRERLVKEGKIKKQKELEAIKEDEIPFEVPENWAKLRIGDIATLITKGSTPTTYGYQYKEIGINFIKVENIKHGKLLYDTLSHFIDNITHEFMKRSQLEKDDILFSIAGTIGEVCIVKNEYLPANTNQAFAIIRGTNNILNAKYLEILLNIFVKKSAVEKARGGAMNNISLSDITNFVALVPPKAEQHRIVTKVEFLMSEIDKLEEFLQMKAHIIELLPKAVVDAIGNCKTGEELKEQLQFVLENFETVFQTPESMQELRNVVLQLAIEGKLVPQEHTDEPSSKLVKRIQVERDRLVKEGKIKKQQSLEPIEEEDIPFEVPGSWEWVRLGAVIELLSGQDFSPDMYNDKENGIPYMTGASNFKEKGLLVNRWTENPRCIAEKGDLLIVCKGSGYGKTIVCDVDKVHVARQIMSIKKNIDLNLDYMNIYLKASFDEIKSKGQGVIPGLDRDSIVTLIYPLPPLSEQHRIVQKVEAIMTLIDQMENELKRKVDLVGKMASL